MPSENIEPLAFVSINNSCIISTLTSSLPKQADIYAISDH